MKGMGRIRKRAKWTGVGACAVILAAWGVSEIWAVKIERTRETVVSLDGIIIVTSFYPWWFEPQETLVLVPVRDVDRSFGFVRPKLEWMRESIDLIVPYWTLLLLAGVPTALLFFLDRRKIRPGHCNQCGYDLRTMTGGRCPECGLAPAAKG